MSEQMGNWKKACSEPAIIIPRHFWAWFLAILAKSILI